MVIESKLLSDHTTGFEFFALENHVFEPLQKQVRFLNLKDNVIKPMQIQIDQQSCYYLRISDSNSATLVGRVPVRYSKEHKEKTRHNIMNAALAKFRTEGYNGIGVDGISKEAGVTSGAFYKHFESKSDAFRGVVSEGLSALRSAIASNQQNNGQNWLNGFMKWYFSFPDPTARDKDCGPLPMQGGCALPTLSPEVARTDPETQRIFEQELSKIVDVLAAGLPNGLTQKRRISWTVLSLMVGGVVLARSVHDDKTAQEISASVLSTIKKLTQ